MDKDIADRALQVTHWIGSLTSLLGHTAVFIGCYAAVFLGFLNYDHMLLALTTAVSLEAIYLSIFIQMTLNNHSEEIGELQSYMSTQEVDGISPAATYPRVIPYKDYLHEEFQYRAVKPSDGNLGLKQPTLPKTR